MSTEGNSSKIPILLLKTKSAPTDAYEDLFSTPRDGLVFEPIFVPVMEHRFLDDGMTQVRSLLQGRKIGREQDCQYGGLVFTSQRAVEAFAKLVSEGSDKNEAGWPHLQDIPVYSVGPATTRALHAIPQPPTGLGVYGEHTGNGETLAPFIMDHYGKWYSDRATKPPLLFLTGEVRRDVIPRVLMDPALPADRRIQVDEVVIYGTGVMESFERDLRAQLERTRGRPVLWVVVFSPMGCEGMLRGLGLLGDDTSGDVLAGRKSLVATIGPTTKAFLEDSFGFKSHVCAEKPSPEGVWSGISKYMTL